MGKWLDALDHPIIFVLLLMMALAGMSSIVVFLFKSAGVQGAASALRGSA